MSTSPTPSRPPEFDAGQSSSPFFPIAAALMATINSVLGTLSGWFSLPDALSGPLAAGYVAAYALTAGVLVPLAVVGVLRLTGKARGRIAAAKAFFFVAMLLFPLLVVVLTSNVVERLDLVRRPGTVEARAESMLVLRP